MSRSPIAGPHPYRVLEPRRDETCLTAQAAPVEDPQENYDIDYSQLSGRIF
jgi:hypothetical protein